MSESKKNFDVRELISHWATTDGKRTALDDVMKGITWSYQELAGIVSALHQDWHREQFPEYCIILGDASIHTAAVYVAVLASGRTAIMVDADNIGSQGESLISSMPRCCVLPEQLINSIQWAPQTLVSHWPIESPNEVESVFLTSGSTGVPKIFAIPKKERRPALLDVGDDVYSTLNTRRPSSIVYRANIYRALIKGGVFVAGNINDSSPQQFDKALDDRLLHEVSMTPTMVRNLLPNFSGQWTNSMRLVNLNGERLKITDLEIIFEYLPNTVVRVSYGLTEFGTVSEKIVRREDLHKLNEPLTSGVPVLDVKIVDSMDSELGIGEIGRILVRRVQGLTGNFSSDGMLSFKKLSETDWHDTGDRGQINLDGELIVVGRWQETVKVKGSRISLVDVEREILATGLAKEAIVATYVDRAGNTAIGAMVVTRDDTNVTLAGLRQAMSATNPLVMCPTRLITEVKLPVLMTGKIDRLGVSNLLSKFSLAPANENLSRTSKVIRDVVQKVLSCGPCDVNDDLFELGADSISCLALLDELVDIFGISFDVRIILEFSTIAKLSNAIENYIRPNGRIVNLTPEVSESPVAIFWILPGINPFMGRKLAEALPGFHHRAVLNPGSMTDDVVITDTPIMARSISQAIQEEVIEGQKYFVVGYSSACYLANEVVIDLLDSAVNPTGLIVIDPPKLDGLIQSFVTEGKSVNPYFLMLAREGRLAKLDPVQADHALFELQVFALATLEPRIPELSTFSIGSPQHVEGKNFWNENKWYQSSCVELDHLDFLRKPEFIADQLLDYLRNGHKFNQ